MRIFLFSDPTITPKSDKDKAVVVSDSDEVEGGEDFFEDPSEWDDIDDPDDEF
jgi:hypothetical protein